MIHLQGWTSQRQYNSNEWEKRCVRYILLKNKNWYDTIFSFSKNTNGKHKESGVRPWGLQSYRHLGYLKNKLGNNWKDTVCKYVTSLYWLHTLQWYFNCYCRVPVVPNTDPGTIIMTIIVKSSFLNTIRDWTDKAWMQHISCWSRTCYRLNW